MAFNDVFVDEACLVDLIDEVSQKEGISSLTELLRELQRNDCCVFVGKDYWEWLVGNGGLALYSILYEEEPLLQFERELIRELTALLGRCQTV